MNRRPAADRCARCGASFHCGAQDAEPCVCTTIKLDAAALTQLRQAFDGCLCLRCLREIQAGAAVQGQSRPWP